MNKQKLLKLFLILIGLLIIIFSSLFVINSLNYLDNLKLSQVKFPIHHPQDNPQPSQYKTYRNETIGIEFQYPTTYKDPEIEKIDSQTKKQGLMSGQAIVIWFQSKDQKEYSCFSFSAYSSDYKAFLESPFTGSVPAVSLCPKQNNYDLSGNVCRVTNNQGAVMENTITSQECSLGFTTRFYFNNQSKSLYKGIELSVNSLEAQNKARQVYSCLNEEEEQKSFNEAKKQSENIMNKKDLSKKDLDTLNIMEEIANSIKFIN